MSDPKLEPEENEVASEVTSVAKAAQEVGKVGVLAQLFGPSAKLLGEHWAQKLENYLTPEEEENVEAHLDAVSGKLPDPDDVQFSPTLAGALIEWTDGVRSIDPNVDVDRSEAWQDALRSAFEGDYSLISILPNLSDTDIRLLKNGGSATRDQINLYIKSGLGNVSIEQKLLGFIIWLIVSVFFTAIISIWLIDTLNLRDESGDVSDNGGILFFIMMIIIFLSFKKFGFWVTGRFKIFIFMPFVFVFFSFNERGMYLRSMLNGKRGRVYQSGFHPWIFDPHTPPKSK